MARAPGSLRNSSDVLQLQTDEGVDPEVQNRTDNEAIFFIFDLWRGGRCARSVV